MDFQRKHCLGLLCGIVLVITILYTIMIFKPEKTTFSNFKFQWNDLRNIILDDKHPASIISEDGQVRSCISGSVVGTGIKGSMGEVVDYLSPVELTGSLKELDDLSENRNESRDSFRRIFHDRSWGGDRKSPAASGAGSTIHFAVETMIGLEAIIAEIKSRHGLKRIRMLDVPCGDMQWMQRFLDQRDDIDYTGMEIVPELIERHRKTFASKPWTFRHHDIIKDGLKEQFDIIHCRHMLQHIRTKDAMNFFAGDF